MNLKVILNTLIILFLSELTVYGDSFNDRKRYILEYYSSTKPNAKFWRDDDIKTSMGYALARLALNKDVNTALDMINRMQDRSLDMFNCHGNIDAYLRFGSKYPEMLKEKVKKKMTGYDYKTNGTTENHKLMYKTAGYLTALAFPDWDKSKETMDYCRSELFKIMENIVLYGQKEYDSSTYGTFYITCLLSLYDHAVDPEMKNRAKMTLEWILLNFAPEWLHGYFVSSSLREYFFACSPRLETPYPIVGWLLLGNGPNPSLDPIINNDSLVVNCEGYFSPLVALTSYRVPEVILNIASNRSKDYVHKESHDMNPASQVNYPWGFKKYTYVNKNYILASQWDGLSLGWSGQMRRWKLTWESDAAASTFFTTHPCDYSGSEELLIGATPREQILQNKGTLIAMYKIEAAEPYSYITGVIPIDAVKSIREDKSGWIFVDGGSILFGIKFTNPYQWDNDRYFRGVRHRIIKCNFQNTAMVLETALPEEYSSISNKTKLDLFAEDIIKNTRFDAVNENELYAIKYTSRTGDKMKMIFNRERSINGINVDYNSWPLISDPWIEQSIGGQFLELKYDHKLIVYDFKNWKILSSPCKDSQN